MKNFKILFFNKNSFWISILLFLLTSLGAYYSSNSLLGKKEQLTETLQLEGQGQVQFKQGNQEVQGTVSGYLRPQITFLEGTNVLIVEG